MSTVLRMRVDARLFIVQNEVYCTHIICHALYSCNNLAKLYCCVAMVAEMISECAQHVYTNTPTKTKNPIVHMPSIMHTNKQMPYYKYLDLGAMHSILTSNHIRQMQACVFVSYV
jgi:hypothetical protein